MKNLRTIVNVAIMIFSVNCIFAFPPIYDAGIFNLFDKMIKNSVLINRFPSYMRKEFESKEGFYTISLLQSNADFRCAEGNSYNVNLLMDSGLCREEWVLMHTNRFKKIYKQSYDNQDRYFEMGYSIYFEESSLHYTFVYHIVIDEMNISDNKQYPKVGRTIGRIVAKRQLGSKYECTIL